MYHLATGYTKGHLLSILEKSQTQKIIILANFEKTIKPKNNQFNWKTKN